MPMPPPKTLAGPNAPALAALMSWLDPKPALRNIDGVEQPACSNGRDVLQSLQLPPGVADSLAGDIDVWLSIGRIGAVPLPETIDPNVARIIMQRLRAMAPGPSAYRPPVIGTPVKEGLSKATKITHRMMHSGRIARQKVKMQKAGERGGHVIGYTSGNKAIYASHHESNAKALGHMHETPANNDGAHAVREAHGSYSKSDHIDAAEAHQRVAGTTTSHEKRKDSHLMSQAHSMAAMMQPVKKSMRATKAYAGVRKTFGA